MKKQGAPIIHDKTSIQDDDQVRGDFHFMSMYTHRSL